MGLHPDVIGGFFYPDFARYIEYYTDPKKFFEGHINEEDAMTKLNTFHDVQQDLIRRAEEKKKKDV